MRGEITMKFKSILISCAAIVFCILSISSDVSYAKKNKANKKSKDSISEYQQYMSTVDFGSSDKEMYEADKIRVESLKGTYSLLKDKSIANSEKFELYLRLGQIHLERHDFLKHIELKEFDVKSQSYQKTYNDLMSKNMKSKAAALKEPKVSHKRSKIELSNAEKALGKAIKTFPKEPRLDIALFTYGQIKLLMKDKSGHKYLERLVKQFPRSRLIPEASLALGEFHFDETNFKKAEKYYIKLLKYKNHKGYLYAVYKLGWTNYNLSFSDPNKAKRLAKAFASFKVVIKQSQKNRWKNTFNLREEALNDVILVLGEIGSIPKARDFFIPQNEHDRYYTTIMRIGSNLTDSGKNKEAIAAYFKIIKERPYLEHIPVAFKKIISNYESLGDISKVSNTLSLMTKFFGKGGVWDKGIRKVKPEAYREAKELLAQDLRHYGTKYHKIGQKSANKNFLLTAAKIYQLYLSQYDENEVTIELRHYLADILIGFKDYKQAGKHFMIVLKSKYGKKFKKEALDNALFSFEQQMEIDQPNTKSELASKSSPEKLPELTNMYLDALETLASKYPNDKRRVGAELKIAHILYNSGYYDRSLKRLYDLTKNYPTNKLADSAAKLYVNHYFAQKEWIKTISSTGLFLKNKLLMKQKGLQSYMLAITKDSYFNYASKLEKDGEYAKSAAVFAKFQKSFPRDKNADKALYNSSINYLKGGKTERSLDMGKNLINTYPNSKLSQDMMAWVADTLESTAKFDEAIVYYQLFHKTYPNDRRSRQFLYNAAILSLGIDEKGQSSDLLDMYTRFYPKDDSAEDIKFSSAEVKLKVGKYTEARQMYEWLSFNASSDERRLEAKAYGTVILLKQDKKSGIKRLNSFARQLAGSRVNAYEARQVVGEELLNLLEPELLSYSRMKIADGDKLMEDIGAKNQKLKWLSSKLEEVASVGLSEFSAAALYILGDLHESIASDILNAPYPSNLDEQGEQEIKSQLLEVSTPLFNDSKSFYTRAYELSQQINTFSEWSIKIARKMKEIVPDKIALSEIDTVQPDYLSHKIKVNEVTKPLLR